MKKILITGSGSGLGKEAAIFLAKRGHQVYATTHYVEEVEYLNNYAKENKLNLIAFKLDILLEVDRNKVLDIDIDTYIANAAIGDSGSVAEIDINKIKNVFETNVFCNILLAQIIIRKMINNNINGRLIFLSSLCGRIPLPFLSPYCSSKFALESFIQCLKFEMRQVSSPNIEVCIIEPGAYATGFNRINYEKKYIWMKNNSYFKYNWEKLKNIEDKFWNITELKNFDSIINKYVKAVEDKKVKFRYTAPKYQAILVRLGRIFGL
ncbi:MAG: sDR1 [Clostridia bacterium]|jgi:short-subunit dehydrogenase|nr:sDR1 [Clostridia bacterium]